MAKRTKTKSLRWLSFRLFLFTGLVFCFAGLLGYAWYSQQDTATQERIQLKALRAIDRLRESKSTPPEIIHWADLLADKLPVNTGTVVDAGAVSRANTFLYGGMPRSSRALRLLQNKGYLVGYDEKLQNPAWVAYRVVKMDDYDAPPRHDKFEMDRRTQSRVRADAFARSGYDRGHLAPSYAIGLCYGAEAQVETFLMSNISPQNPLLNRTLWGDLEQRVARRYGKRFDTIWVLCGPTFKPVPKYLDADVAIPEQFYMILLDELDSRHLRALAFLIPNEAPEGEDLRTYLTSIDIVEQYSGLDFFPDLPDDTEGALETVQPTRLW
ncbi:MAG: DNA/RNA non-specific endonuclease [Verrucomicrobiota bacterium]|nr:DNA/RNA non-specific endonuclease [Verrucomicrobiota bacterium]